MSILRRFDGVSYWVIEDPREISEFVNINIRKEWESDCVFEGKDPGRSEWLLSLKERKWELKVVGVRGVGLNQELMNYSDTKTGYDFAAHLKERKERLKDGMQRYGAVIPPVVLRAEDNQLMDGYCRYSALKDMGVKRIYAYVGSTSKG